MKGRIKVVKNDLEARFVWSPEDTGTEYDLEGLRGLLAASDVRVEVSEDLLLEVLDFFSSQTEETESDIIAAGIPPVAPTPLRVKIISTELPEDVGTKIPELFEGRPSEEGVEPSYIWAEQESIVGQVTPAVPARAGLALNRDPIPPPESKEDDFHVGDHLEIRGENLVALSEGVLRWVPSGADIRPTRRHKWAVSGGPEEGGCFLDYEPGDSVLLPPSLTDILEAAGRRGILPEKLLPEEEIRNLISSAAAQETVFSEFPISRDSDGRMNIAVDDLQVFAELQLRKATGNGKPLVLNEIAALIRNSGLKGLDGDRVKAEIMTFWKGENPSAAIVLKEGSEPERGPDRELEYLIPFLDEEDAAPVRMRLESEPEKARGLPSLQIFPPQSVSKIAIVEKDQPVGRLGPAKKGKSGKDIHGNELPGYPGNDPDLRIHEGLGWNGEDLVAEADGVMDIGTTVDGATHLRVRPHQDALVQVDISEDRIKAFVSTRLPVGTGAPVDADRIREAAKKAGVIKGLSESSLADVAERSLSGELFTGHLIAEGQLPMGGDTQLSLLVSGDPAQAPVPVKAGERIGTVKAGSDAGWNVLGEALVDEGATLSEGENIRREENDGETVLVAEKGGHLVMGDGTLKVRHLLDFVGDVSLASGNIRFPGRIKVEGSILSRVVVDGGEGVEVSEVVQAALVNSGGDISVGKGVKGEGKAVLRCQGKLRLGYAEEANLLVTENILVVKALMNCRVKCNGRLEVSAADGRIIGGVMKLKDGLDSYDVGNERGVETTVSFGQDYLVENQINQTMNETRKIQEFIDRTDKMMAELEQKGDSRKLIMVREKKVDALKMLEKKNLKLFLLREKFERHFPSEVKVKGTAWPGVVFESHGRLFKVESPVKSFSIRFNPESGRIERSSL